MIKFSWGSSCASLLGVMLMGSAYAQTGQQDKTANANDPLKSGEYLAILGDCTACHTKVGGEAYAGGYEIKTPMGTIYSSNITPSKTAGIGTYTEQQFARAVREGVRADGSLLYPAMVYTAYAKMSDEDIHDLYSYFMQKVEPVDIAAPTTNLKFPYVRPAMYVWNFLFLDKQHYQLVPDKSAEWNRGKFLVEGPAHCGACHSPRGFMMNEESSSALQGAPLSGWYAPDITNNLKFGLGSWSVEEVGDYLKTGRLIDKGQAAGGMAEAVEHSFQHMSDSDLRAIAVYLKSLPGSSDQTGTSIYDYPTQPVVAQSDPQQVSMDSAIVNGQRLFNGACASCHGLTATGALDKSYPALTHNSALVAGNGDNLIMTILYGVDRTVGNKHVFMPGFSNSQEMVEHLTDSQIASLANYVIKNFGNPTDAHFSAQDVEILRNGGPNPPLVAAVDFALPGILIFGIVVIALILWRGSSRSNSRSRVIALSIKDLEQDGISSKCYPALDHR